ncbi:hypothetical protein CO493_RS06035 [Vibrio parahaemolyticus]|uniref:hypothetical protein n=1 Tax=Vibrio parahaemolyticus TaxID=670 RepID=UPI00064AB1F6|nr:hypothetical protein [Vibrio parahaemolyticus]EGQ9318458.1 hypothetical protein [Vibrio parahaemolyticus]EJG1471762.1 hypothetical protein [Vibrio parahaemolyticus]EKA7408214.1 hypothetical protein [Vibrio parahaemolyticus]EKG9658373.1 hypothetical protein [Vibrio parahaemolyticus]ODZ28524.1 hypothetical protein BBM36_01260 [Vibrio parahaemolyticus]
MIPISHVLPLVEKQITLLQPKEAVQFKTYKKDRGFLIYCIDNSQFQIIETGFTNTSSIGDANSTKKHAQKALKREFPRSNMVWVTYYQNVESPFNIDDSNSHQHSLF